MNTHETLKSAMDAVAQEMGAASTMAFIKRNMPKEPTGVLSLSDIPVDVIWYPVPTGTQAEITGVDVTITSIGYAPRGNVLYINRTYIDTHPYTGSTIVNPIKKFYYGYDLSKDFGIGYIDGVTYFGITQPRADRLHDTYLQEHPVTPTEPKEPSCQSKFDDASEAWQRNGMLGWYDNNLLRFIRVHHTDFTAMNRDFYKQELDSRPGRAYVLQVPMSFLDPYSQHRTGNKGYAATTFDAILIEGSSVRFIQDGMEICHCSTKEHAIVTGFFDGRPVVEIWNIDERKAFENTPESSNSRGAYVAQKPSEITLSLFDTAAANDYRKVNELLKGD